MQNIFYQQQPPRMKMPGKPSFKVFIACEDKAAFSRARKVENRVRALCGHRLKLARVFWTFSLLRYEQFQEYAAMEAAEAVIIVVSLDSSNELPAHVKRLLESLPVRPQAGQAALVALIAPELKARHHITYLRQIAESRGLDFFCNQNFWGRLDISRPSLQSAARTTALENIISVPIQWRKGEANTKLKMRRGFKRTSGLKAFAARTGARENPLRLAS
jgi:hypothetical protein